MNERIEAAWKERCGQWELPPGAEGFFKDGAKAGIAIGRGEALRELYVEVKPGDVSAAVDYWVLKDGVWRDAWWFSDRLALGEARKCDKILKLNLPSPSAVFGGGVNNKRSDQ